jgi:hypothetical protein
MIRLGVYRNGENRSAVARIGGDDDAPLLAIARVRDDDMINVSDLIDPDNHCTPAEAEIKMAGWEYVRPVTAE